ncbi:hypothetical protein HY045_00985 [Candidatus Woesebacteria bacterium]|nr:hypothetical protein [Candidatus Woesebacteria bacterium]
MSRRIVVILSSFVIGFFVFFASVIKASSAVKPTFTPKPKQPILLSNLNNGISNSGMVLPGSLPWSIKAITDRMRIEATLDTYKKFDLILDTSGNRLMLSKVLFDSDKPDTGLSTLTKSEKYLESAYLIEERKREQGENTSNLLLKLRDASLNNQATIEEILNVAPESLKPEIIKAGDISRRIYLASSKLLSLK